jgi:catechol 2,3-dioxygenase-like lactoylglutathione lyase family enzyme
MLGDRDAMITIAVKDASVAQEFYERVLGLRRSDEEVPGGTVYTSGSSTFFIYESAFAGTNQATAASWIVDDALDQIVEDLRERGVAFQHYDDLPETTREGDIHVMGEFRAAWFKDPDGNILNLAGR